MPLRPPMRSLRSPHPPPRRQRRLLHRHRRPRTQHHPFRVILQSRLILMPESHEPATNTDPLPGGFGGGSGISAELVSLTHHAFQLRSQHLHALHPIEAALQYHRAATQGLGSQSHATVGFEQAESHYRAGTQGLRLSEIPQLPQQLRELSRLSAADRAGRKALRKWAVESGQVVCEAEFLRTWQEQGKPGGAEHQVFHDKASNRWFKRLYHGVNFSTLGDYLVRMRLHAPLPQNCEKTQPRTLTGSAPGDYRLAITPVVVFGFVQSTTAPRRLRSAGFLFARQLLDTTSQEIQPSKRPLRSRPVTQGWTPIRKTTPQCLHQLRTQAKFRFRQSSENILKIDQASRRRIRQQTRRAGDAQSQRVSNPASSLFIKNQQAGIPVLPSQGNRRGLSSIQGSSFLKIRQSIGDHSDPIRHCQKQGPQAPWGTRMHGFMPDSFGDRDLPIKPTKKIQLTDFRQTRKNRIVTDDDHWAACRNSNDLRASSRISSADCDGQAPNRERTACASQRDSNSSNLRTCSSESTSFAYASAAKASSAACPRFSNSDPSSAARSSGMFTVKVIDRHSSQIAPQRKPENEPPDWKR